MLYRGLAEGPERWVLINASVMIFSLYLVVMVIGLFNFEFRPVMPSDGSLILNPTESMGERFFLVCEQCLP